MRLRGEWIGLLLVLAGLLRAALLVAHDPMVGYANQYDMLRTSACIAFYPAIPEPARFAATPLAPEPEYRPGPHRPEICYLSSEVAIAAVAIAVARSIHGADVLPLRYVGFAKLALLAAAALLLAWALHRNPAAALLHGLVVLVVLGDPVATLWMNTLYTEYAAIWALYVAIASLATLALTERGMLAVGTLLLASLAALAFSREQMALLPAALVLAALPWLLYRSRRLAAAALTVALATSLASFLFLPRPADVRAVNRADTYLGLVLPSSSRPAEALAVLGLPARCEPLIGATWYLPRGENIRETCPEVLDLPSTAFLRFAAAEPAALARSVARILPTLAMPALPYLGTIAGARAVTVDRLPGYLASPLQWLALRLGVAVFAVAMVAMLLAGPLALLAAIAWARPSRSEHGTALLLAMLMSMAVGYALLTTVFGDGRGESARHFLPGALTLVAAALALCVALPGMLRGWLAAPRTGAMQAVAAIVAVALVAAACVKAWDWARTQPLAIGVVDQPVGREARAPFALRGWALDPFGVESVELTLGSLKRTARAGLDSRDLAGLYPAYPGGAAARFELDLSADELAQARFAGPLEMRVTVHSRAGTRTEIDRRVVQFQ